MSISGSLNSAISGLAATSRMAQAVSSNLSNALTDGYGRREVLLSSSRIGGVSVDGISRNVDPAILAERRLADAGLGSSQRAVSTLSQLETVVGQVDDPFSVASKLVAFEQSLVTAAADPASEQRLSNALTRLGDVTQALTDATRSTQILRQDADADIARDIETLNVSLEQVAKLNTDIGRALNTGGDVSALLDARQVAIDKITGIVPLREVSRPNGAVALITTRGATLLDGVPSTFEFTPTPTIVADMNYAGGVLGGITSDGTPLVPNTGFGRLSGGSLEAAFKLRDETLPSAQLSLDEMAADLITRFEAATADPTLGATDPGLLTDNGARFDLTQLTGLAGRIEINAAVDPKTNGDVWRLRDGVAAAAPGPVGDGTQIDNWLDSLSMNHAYTTGAASRTASGQAGHMSSDIGTLRLRAEETMSYESARWNLLKEAELADGVDSDQELQKLLVIEQAYSANAKLIQTATSMLQTLMEL